MFYCEVLSLKYISTSEDKTTSKMKLVLYLSILSAVSALSDAHILQQKFESLEKLMGEKDRKLESLHRQVNQLTEKLQHLETERQLDFCKDLLWLLVLCCIIVIDHEASAKHGDNRFRSVRLSICLSVRAVTAEPFDLRPKCN